MSKEYCKLFCRGASCSKENLTPASELQVSKTMAVPPLLSNWITESILAMQRPSDIHFARDDLVKRFRDEKIGGVFNLQMPLEHAFCGNGLFMSVGKTGRFSYDPEILMNAEIAYFEFGWEDMTTPTNELMLRLVQVMHQVIAERKMKIAVHCHAGLGRTGLCICCYILYSQALSDSPKETYLDSSSVIGYIRSKRPGTVETLAQQKFVRDFEAHLRRLRSDSLWKPLDLEEYLKVQGELVAGSSRVKYKFAPKLAVLLVERLVELGYKMEENTEWPRERHSKGDEDCLILDAFQVPKSQSAINLMSLLHKFFTLHPLPDIEDECNKKIVLHTLALVFKPLLKITDTISLLGALLQGTAHNKRDLYLRTLEKVNVEHLDHAPFVIITTAE